jgi:coenzyme F420-0:L-glutamate ligase/coenzyme F420-1:gamma-L-glutamate ligase
LLAREGEMNKVEILGLDTVPEIKPGDKLADIIVRCAKEEANGIQEKDIIVVTSKIVSKAENRLAVLSEVKPGKKAERLSRRTGKAASERSHVSMQNNKNNADSKE